MEYEPTLTRPELKTKHIVELAIGRRMGENGEDIDPDISEGEEVDGDELINAIKEGSDNLKRPENQKKKLKGKVVGPGKASISWLSGWQTGLTAKQWIE
eukprot:5743224-Prymnesium_polylepis.1